MSEMVSSKLLIENMLSMNQIMELNQIAKQYEGNIYLYTHNKSIIDVGKLPSLIAFFLTVKAGCSIKCIIDGQNTNTVLENLREVLQPENHHRLKTVLFNSDLKMKV
ncbi:hypothetical protein [Metabacillus arenae]|uniref:Uncharacterized protein n=1 Tax=Metabacillus arenae TaxID=2771434 RepID=A0A926NKD7_9BACI|nr:hypothetical protein [Metabacillus arenae]MBD1383394.1 hypothetical protein [Metabacillus arenae]